MNASMDALMIAQRLPTKPVYTLKDLISSDVSQPTAYRRLRDLEEMGIAERVKKGYFALKDCVRQPISVIKYLTTSLNALKEGRTFGKYYTEADVRVAQRLSGFVTLDYRAYELTKFQTPSTFYVYVDSIDETSKTLKGNGFSEGTNGHVTILSKCGEFANPIQRVYLDCLAKGGRSILDAIAIEILYPDELHIKGSFPVDLIQQVREGLITNEPITR